jgi:pimeloyl-ACP methyl ester carboxylesterase
MHTITHRQIDTNGISMHVAEAGTGFPVLFCHGWPELWYSWRHQLRGLAAAGFRAIAPDQRGYGDTDAPPGVEQYTIHHLVGDLTGLLDALEIEKAVLVGHDWGGAIVWQMALLAPHRVERVVGVNTPYFPRLPIRPTTMMQAMAQGNFHYILHFQEPGIAEAELDPNVRRVLSALYQRPNREMVEAARQLGPGMFGPAGGGLLERLPPGTHGDYLSAEDFEVFASTFERTGFRGGLNWYRNFDRNWELTAYLHAAKVTHPALMITAELDAVLRPEMAEGMETWVPYLRRTHLVEDCGHWTQQEKPDEVNRVLIEFLADLR